MARVDTQRKRESGLSLVEVMVGTAILGIVTWQSLSMLSSQIHTFHQQERVIEVQEDARLVSDMILTDVRMAGFMLPEIAGIASNDGGTANADMLCTSDWEFVDEGELADASSRFAGAVPTAISGGSLTLNAADLDVDGDGTDDFVQTQGVIITDGTNTHCATITNMVGGSITFAPNVSPVPTAANTIAVPANVYVVNTGTLTRNGLVISNQVEDLQVEFGVDINSDGLIGAGEFPLNSLNTNPLDEILQVRLHVLTVTQTPDANVAGTGRQAVANRNAGAADNLRRRLATTLTWPRNL